MRRGSWLLIVVLGCGGGPSESGNGNDRDGGSTKDGPGTDGDGAAEDGVPRVGACPVFTADDAWNIDVRNAPVSAAWTTKFQTRYASVHLHPDFGNYEDEHYGIPINVVPSGTAAVPVTYDLYAEESDPGPVVLPLPTDVRIEGTDDPTSCDGDCHLLAVAEGTCEVFEGWLCRYDAQDGYVCANGARFDLERSSQGQRPDGYTSADAAGLSILAGLARYDEAAAGAIRHALRFTVACTQSHYVSPASHQAVPNDCDGDDPNAPPMGMRVRLRADFDTDGYSAIPKAFLEAMKHYGFILADNGSDFYFQSEADPRWGDELDELKQVPATAFEVLEPGTFH
ncbi:MAG: hypothetical protein R3A78_03395 [Polyangiales bacterium]